MNRQISSQDWQNLSDYLDRQLSPQAEAKLVADLKQNQGLKGALGDLQFSRALLKNLPRRHAPHNFTLSAESLPSRISSFPFVPAFSLASVMCTLLLLFSLLFHSGSSSQSLEAVNSAPQAKAANPQADANNATAPTPEVFTWGETSSGQAMGLGGGPMDKAAPAPAAAALPPPEAASRTIPTQAPAPMGAALTPVENTPIEGGGPILGLRPTNEQGLEYGRTPQGVSDNSLKTLASQPTLPLPQISLAILAAFFALAAILFRFRNRR